MERIFGKWKVTQGMFSAEAANGFFLEQVHGCSIVPAAKQPTKPLIGDGIYIEELGLLASVRTADCVPLVIMTDTAGLVLHISRKSAVAGLLTNAAKYVDVARIQHVWIGPHICPEHFIFERFGTEIQMFQKMFPLAVVKENPWHLSLQHVIRTHLDSWEVPREAVRVDGRCTYEDPALPSYKRWLAGGKKGALPYWVTSLSWLRV